MMPVFIGVAGGSGAGKSSLCTALMDKYPDQVGLIQLDDYFKPSGSVPILGGLENWDHPDSLFLDRLAADIKALGEWQSVTINTKNERLNPDYARTDKRIPVVFVPRPLMLVEGYLVLYDKAIRDQLNEAIWLEVDHETRWGRRVHFKDEAYAETVLKPMHAQYAEPTKKFATLTLDVSGLGKDEVLSRVETYLKRFLRK